MNRRLKAPALLAVSALTLAGCATASPAPDVDAIRYDSPPFSGTAFSDCVKAGGYQMAPPWAGADFFDYPAGQRTYAFSGDGKGADAPAFKANTSDGVEMTVSGVVGFKLNTDCDSLKSFHENIGLKFEAPMRDGQTSEGWQKMLDTYLGASIQRAVNDATQARTWKALYADPKTKTEWEADVKAKLPVYVKQAMGGAYFDGFAPTIQKPEIPQDLSDSLRAAQVAVQQSKAQQERNVQVKSELESIKALVAVLGPDGYVAYQAIKDGKISVIPIPQGSSVVVQPKDAK